MSDIIDRAAEQEEIHRQTALNIALIRASEHQDIDDDGNHYCNDCGRNIPAARMAAVPLTVCCIDCQTIREHKGKHFV